MTSFKPGFSSLARNSISALLKTLTAALLIAAVAPMASAQSDFPNKPLKLIVPLSPGGNVDIVARLLAQEMSKDLGQPVIVENRPGASSIVGTVAVAKSPADGYTMLAIGNTFIAAASLIPNIGYDPVKDFVGLSRTVTIPMVLVVNPAVPVSTVNDLISLVKANPAKGTNGTAGVGSTSHFAGELFASQAGVRILHVPYKGNAQALTDVMGGQVTMMFDSLGSSAASIKSGRVKAIALTTRTRSPAFPDVPTISESGLPQYEDVTFNGIVLPAGTPPAIIARLHSALTKAMNDPGVRKNLADRGIDSAVSATPMEFTAYLKAENERYGQLVRSRGMTAQ